MCGLLGFAAKAGARISPDLASYILVQLMHANDARGGDSFGVAVVCPDAKTFGTYKDVGHFDAKVTDRTFRMALREITQIMDASKSVLVMGHNRKATMGENTPRNAHPFQFGKVIKGEPNRFIIGAHNGVVHNPFAFKDGWGLTRPFEVDSEVIFRAMQEHDEMQVISQLRNHASMALTYIRDFETLKLARISNPIAVAANSEIVFWSSEALHLRRALLGLDMTTVDLKLDTIASINLSDLKLTMSEGPKASEPPFDVKKYESRFLAGKSASSGASSAWGDEREHPFGESGADDRTGGYSSRRPYYSSCEEPYYTARSFVNKTEVGCCTVCDRQFAKWQMFYERTGSLCAYCHHFLIGWLGTNHGSLLV